MTRCVDRTPRVLLWPDTETGCSTANTRGDDRDGTGPSGFRRYRVTLFPPGHHNGQRRTGTGQPGNL